MREIWVQSLEDPLVEGKAAHGVTKSQTRLSKFHFPQGIFPTHGSKLGLLYCLQILYSLNYQRSPL